MRKAALHNLGCKVNAYETEAMEQLLEAAGYEIVSFEEKADVYVINTCSVTNVADKKIPPDAAPGEGKEPGRGGGCGRMLCPGGGRQAERGRRGGSDHREQP